MKSALTGIVLTLSLLAPLPALAQITQASAGPPSIANVVEKLLPSVVNISSTQKVVENDQPLPEMPKFPPGSPFEDFFEEYLGREGASPVPPASLGSGFIVDADKGFIVTNAHVIQDADEVRVTLHDDTTLPAEVIGRDEKTDLALLKVATTTKLTAAHFGDSGPLRVGDWVIAIGNPFGLGGTVTTGIVSAQQRDINAGPYDDFIQTDASINRGNSGGPMFNMAGEVIGINTAIYSPSGGSVGIGFAIPSNLAKPVIDQLMKYGHTRRGWMGVRIQTVTEDIAESLGLEKSGGALIASVTPTGPAEKAGLKAGDVILEFDGKAVTQMRGLPRIVAETDIGKTAPVLYWRDGKQQKTTVTIGELEKAEEDGLLADEDGGTEDTGEPAEGVLLGSVGLTVSTLREQDRETYSIPPDVKGVLVTDITAGGEAAEKGLVPGDIIVEMNQQAATDTKTAQTIVDSAVKDHRSSILLLVSREGDVRFVALRLNNPPKNKKEPLKPGKTD